MLKRLSAIAIAITVAAGSATAQAPRPIELGIDAGASIGLGDNSVTVISIPAQSARVGFFMTPRISIEPKLGLTIVSGNDETVSAYRAEVGVLWHTGTPPAMRSGVYIRPFVGFTGFSNGDSETNGLLGIGAGLKVPMLDRFAARFEANFAHHFGDGSGNELGLLAGLSFFTR